MGTIVTCCDHGRDASTHTMTAEQCEEQFGCSNFNEHHQFSAVCRTCGQAGCPRVAEGA